MRQAPDLDKLLGIKFNINVLRRLLVDIGNVFLFTCCKKKLSERSHAASVALLIDEEPIE